MAYYNKYKLTFATKTSKTAYLYLQEDLGSAPTVIEYPGVSLSLQYLPKSDDPFEPIFASQLNVTMDVTDDLANMPNFVSLNDRKYFAKLYLGADLEWTGFVLSDNVQVTYSTGRKQIYFNCVDALGMLKDIPLPIPNSVNTNTNKSVLYYFYTALNTLNLPTTPNIVTACSYYAATMSNRTTGSQYEPFSQTYLPYRTFENQDYTYMSCLDIITNLVKSFGCRIFMAQGKWWIVAINEFANENVYYTEYTYTGTLVTSGQFNRFSIIQGYTGNTSNVFFIDNSQFKILLKGFNQIQFTKQAETAFNYLSNGNLRPLQSGSSISPENWTASYTGSGSVTYVNNVDEDSARITLYKGTTNTATLEVKLASGGNPASGPYVGSGELMTFSWIYQGQDFSGKRGTIYVSIVGTSSTYYWDGTTWVNGTISSFDVPQYNNEGAKTGGVNTYSFTTALAPIAGQVNFKINMEAGSGTSITVSNLKMTITPVTDYVEYLSYLTSTKQYVKEIEIPYGYAVSGGSYATEKGAFLLSTGVVTSAWYQQGRAVNYTSIVGLLMQQYMNIFAKNIINLDCSLTSFDTANGIMNAAKMLKATDTDPSQINVSSNSYMLGNSTIDYIADSTKATLLQISNTDITCTNSTNVVINNNL